MAGKKKFYWLKLKSDFFDDETIRFIEEQENGIKYSNFYLKLCLKSLQTDGKLMRLVGETLIPYDINSLSKLTMVDGDTVRCAMDLFQKIGLVKILDSGEIYLLQINELIGKETDAAQIMRRKRAEDKALKEGGNNVTQMLPKCYPNVTQSIENRDRDYINNIYGQMDLPECQDETPEEPKKERQDESALSEDFEKIWEIYPRKKGKQDAFKHYKALLKGKKIAGNKVRLTNRQIYDAVARYISYIEENKIDIQYVKHGDSFFNSGIFDYVADLE